MIGNGIGIGTDIVEINRVQQAAERRGQRFLRRIFTAGERLYCEGKKQKWQCYAARFAGKEAVLKALGTGLSGCRWTEIELVSSASGQPRVLLAGAAAGIAARAGIGEVLISLSHDGSQAVAFAVALAAAGQ